jgi:hypothetical protein
MTTTKTEKITPENAEQKKTVALKAWFENDLERAEMRLEDAKRDLAGKLLELASFGEAGTKALANDRRMPSGVDIVRISMDVVRLDEDVCRLAREVRHLQTSLKTFACDWTALASA